MPRMIREQRAFKLPPTRLNFVISVTCLTAFKKCSQFVLCVSLICSGVLIRQVQMIKELLKGSNWSGEAFFEGVLKRKVSSSFVVFRVLELNSNDLNCCTFVSKAVGGVQGALGSKELRKLLGWA